MAFLIMSIIDRPEHMFDYNSFTMQNFFINYRIRYEFRSIIKVLIHFSLSLIQLLCALSILGLQITLIITQTCSYHNYIGFWSMPFLLIAPISIWITIWRRNSFACFITILTQLIATLISTSIIIISFFELIKQTECSTSSFNMYYLPLNISFISIAIVFKIFNYCEIILLHRLLRNTDQIPTIFAKDFYKKNYPILLNPMHMNLWHPRSTATSETHSDLDYLFVR